MKLSALRMSAGVSLVLLAACGGSDRASAQAASPSQPAPQPAFVDVTAASNIAYRVGYTRPSLIRRGERGLLDLQVAYMTIGGAAAGDCDGDGDIDLFVTYGNTGGPDGGGGPNRLYLNQLVEQGNGMLFVDTAAEAGVANTRPGGRNNDRHNGPAFADMDGDGDLDLFVGGIYDDPAKIFENQGNCRFADVTANSPDIVAMIASHTLSAGFGDYDLDGDLDMFLTHWGTLDELYANDDPQALQTDHLWRNESDESGIRYVNTSRESGISSLTRLTRATDFHGQVQIADFTFTPTFARINDDVWPDIAVAADFGTSQVAINMGDGTFQSLNNPILQNAQFGMGSALGDIDNDGDLDWFVTSIFGPGNDQVMPAGNRLFVNEDAAGNFVDRTDQFGVADGAFGWGACFLDIDNDGDLDIYHTNGYPVTFLTESDDYTSDPSRAFVMNAAGVYDDRAGALGLGAGNSGRGVVCADFDHDGDIDVFELTEAPGNSARLWENQSAAAGRNFLRVKLEGLPPNTEAAGARIIVTVGGIEQMREIKIGSNYTSQNPTVQLFGLGSAESVDQLLVEWPALRSAAGPEQLGSVLAGPIAASRPGETLILRHPLLAEQ